MKKTTNTSMTFKMRHRTLALLLLILIAFSSASCNAIVDPEQTNNSDYSQNSLTNTEFSESAEDISETEALKYHEVLEIPEEKIMEIKALYDQKIVPQKHTFSPGSDHSFEEGELELQTFGMFGEACAIYAKNESRGVYWEIIKGFEFRYTHATPYIYYNQDFYELGEAVEKGIIYNGDLETIHKSYMEKNYDPYYKQYVIPKIESSFYGKSVYVIVQPQYNDKEYTVEDFAEIGCENVEDVTTFSFEEVPNRIGRKWRLDLGKESKEWAIEVIKMLLERDDVFATQTDYYNEYGAIPNDTEYRFQLEFEKISMPSAWNLQTNASSITVGVIDSGISRLPDLENNINVALSQSFDPADSNPFSDTVGHGTKVAGLIGAETNNSLGIAGICWDVQMVSLKVGVGGQDIIDAINYATQNNIKVINCSMGRTGADNFDEDEYNAISNFQGIFVCISGNNGFDNDSEPYYPASYDLDQIIVVGATSSNDRKSSFSNYGRNSVDLFAPGENIYVMTNTAIEYNYVSGTSYSAPMVTGVVALMWARYPNKTRGWIKDKLLESVDTVSYLNGKCVTGGRLNAHKALCEHRSSNLTYTQTTNGMHIMTCNVCDYQETTAHIYRYTSLGNLQHREYCTCGYSITESHQLVTDMNIGISYCSKCPFQLELWSVRDEHELM